MNPAPSLRVSEAVATALAVLIATAVSGCTEENGAAPPLGAEGLVESLASPRPEFFVGYLPDHVTGLPARWVMENREGLAVVDGDIVLGTVGELSVKSWRDRRANLWSRAVVPFVLGADFPHREVVLAAIEEFHRRTRIKFIAREAEPDYLIFTLTANPAVGGQSYFGRHGGAQPLWLNMAVERWNKGVVIHELGHALAVAHAQCREDRGRFVRIEYANIIPAYRSQFTQRFGAGREATCYDYGSVMHAPRRAFSGNRRDTIVPLQPGVRIGQRERLSEGDIAALAVLYDAELREP